MINAPSHDAMEEWKAIVGRSRGGWILGMNGQGRYMVLDEGDGEFGLPEKRMLGCTQ